MLAVAYRELAPLRWSGFAQTIGHIDAQRQHAAMHSKQYHKEIL